MGLVGVLGGLQALLGLEPDKTELVLNVVNHDGLTLTTGIFLSILSGGVGTLKSEVLVLLLEVLAAVGLPEDGDILGGSDLEGAGEDLVSGDNVLCTCQRFSRPELIESMDDNLAGYANQQIRGYIRCR